MVMNYELATDTIRTISGDLFTAVEEGRGGSKGMNLSKITNDTRHITKMST